MTYWLWPGPADDEDLATFASWPRSGVRQGETRFTNAELRAARNAIWSLDRADGRP